MHHAERPVAQLTVERILSHFTCRICRAVPKFHAGFGPVVYYKAVPPNSC